jgi:hypothetical protein
VRNLGRNDLVNFTCTVRAFGVAPDGITFPIWAPNQTEMDRAEIKELKPGASFECSFTRALATAKIYHDAYEADRARGGTNFPPAKCGITIEVSYQRKLDLKIYKNRSRLLFLWREGTFYAMDASLFSRDLER